MRELDFNEIYFVYGANGNNSGGSGSTVGQYIGAVVGAVCGALTRGVGGAAACAVAGMAVGDFIDMPSESKPLDIPPPGDYSNPAYKNG